MHTTKCRKNYKKLKYYKPYYYKNYKKPKTTRNRILQNTTISLPSIQINYENCSEANQHYLLDPQFVCYIIESLWSHKVPLTLQYGKRPSTRKSLKKRLIRKLFLLWFTFLPERHATLSFGNILTNSWCWWICKKE